MLQTCLSLLWSELQFCIQLYSCMASAEKLFQACKVSRNSGLFPFCVVTNPNSPNGCLLSVQQRHMCYCSQKPAGLGVCVRGRSLCLRWFGAGSSPLGYPPANSMPSSPPAVLAVLDKAIHWQTPVLDGSDGRMCACGVGDCNPLGSVLVGT